MCHHLVHIYIPSIPCNEIPLLSGPKPLRVQKNSHFFQCRQLTETTFQSNYKQWDDFCKIFFCGGEYTWEDTFRNHSLFQVSNYEQSLRMVFSNEWTYLKKRWSKRKNRNIRLPFQMSIDGHHILFIHMNPFSQHYSISTGNCVTVTNYALYMQSSIRKDTKFSSSA